MTEGKKVKKVCNFFFMPNQLVYELKMGHHIKVIRKRFDAIVYDVMMRQTHSAIASDRKHFPFEGRVAERKGDDNYSFVGEEYIFGRDHDKQAVIQLLTGANIEENVSIVQIVGFGGIGKTTLAKLIFNDHRIQEHFELKIWICVSNNFDVKSIVKKVLEYATKKPQSVYLNIDILIDRLRFLLVLDDVRDHDCEKWSILHQSLRDCVKGSKILVTTRKKVVAQISHQMSYCLRVLDKESSWLWLRRVAFKDNEMRMNPSIEEMMREILQIFIGIPLVLKTMGRLSYFKDAETQIMWLEIMLRELPRPHEFDILPILKLKYDILPSHLKLCFAYCCLFSKDYKIDKLTLIKLWIAQGFVKSSETQCLEDVGDKYFKTLIWESLFEEDDWDEYDNVISCKIHSLLYDLVERVAGSLFTTFDDKEKIIEKKTRHMAIGRHKNNSLYKASMLRTLLCPIVKGEIDCKVMFSSLKLLRMVDLSNRKLKYIPSSICELKHLRYLDLSRNWKIRKLPDSITTLINLQTLRASGCESLEELPRNIKRLVNLRHLEIDGCKGLLYMPCALGQLTELQTLSLFVVDSSSLVRHHAGLNELIGLKNLRGKLCIYLKGGVALEYKDEHLSDKPYLDSLHLEWSIGSDVSDSKNDMSLEGFQPHQNLKQLYLHNYWGSSLSSWLLSLTNLVELELLGCSKCQYLPPLSMLPSLKCLSLSDMDAMKYITDCDDEIKSFSPSVAFFPSFPSLASLRVHCCSNLKGWWRNGDSSVEDNCESEAVETEHRLFPSFPSLSRLVIEDCPMLTSMPMFPHLEEQLCLDNASWQPLQQTMTMNTSTTRASSSATPLSNLREMKLVSVTELETLLEWLSNLTSLKSLTIQGCNKLKSLSPGLQHLTSLKNFHLGYCKELEIVRDKDGMQWEALKSLRTLSLTNLPKFVVRPLGLRHVIEKSPDINL